MDRILEGSFMSLGASLPIRRWTFASLSKGEILEALLFRWECCIAISGVGISPFSCGILLHSVSVGNLDVLL